MPPMLEFEQKPTRSAIIWRVSRSSRRRASSQVPTGAGLGIEIDREVLKKYKVAYHSRHASRHTGEVARRAGGGKPQ